MSSSTLSIQDVQWQGDEAKIAPMLDELIECEHTVARATMAIARTFTDYRMQTALYETAIGQTWFAATLSRYRDGKARRDCPGALVLGRQCLLTHIQTLDDITIAKRLRTLAVALRCINKQIDAALAFADGMPCSTILREMRSTHHTSAIQCRYLARHVCRKSGGE